MATEPLGHEDDIQALCERLEDGDMRGADPATAAATIRSLCKQLDESRSTRYEPVGKFIGTTDKGPIAKVASEFENDPDTVTLYRRFDAAGVQGQARAVMREAIAQPGVAVQVPDELAAAIRIDGVQPTDRCPHGIRHPHPCRECEDAPLPDGAPASDSNTQPPEEKERG